jgi:lipopolysaccharide transport system permease protein
MQTVTAPERPPGAPADRRSLPVTVIQPAAGGWRLLSLGDLWAYRELLFFLIWRDIKVRYKQTLLGGLWAVIQPLLLMVVFGIFLGRLAGLSSEGKPYILFAFAALVPWTLFSAALMGAATSVVNSQALISKVYFPRPLIPLAAAGGYVVDFLIALGVLGVMMAAYGEVPGVKALFIVPLTLLALTAAIAVGLWLAALNVRYRDVAYTIPFLVQIWLFASPVGYSSTLVPEPWHTIYGLNPMAGVVEGFRWALLDTEVSPGPILAVSVAVTFVLLLGGLYYFRRTERTFADVI